MNKIISAFAVLFAILANAAVAQDSYSIRAGDILRIEVLEDTSLNQDVLVAPDGRISIPLAGTLRASGRTVGAIRTDVTEALAPNFNTRPTVYVALLRQAERIAPSGPAPVETVAVYVLGEAAKVGRHDVEVGTNLIQFFAESGGFGKFAATKRIVLRRTVNGQPTDYLINYEDILAGTSNSGATTVADGDLIIVPQRKLFE